MKSIIRLGAIAMLLLSMLAATPPLHAASMEHSGTQAIALTDPCTTVAPSKTLTLGAGVAEVSSIGANYFASPCYRYVVDVNVPRDSSAGPHFLRTFNFSGKTTNFSSSFGGPYDLDGCKLYHDHLQVYRKNLVSGKFEAIGGGWRSGQWVSESWFGGPAQQGCRLILDSGYTPVPDWQPPTFWGNLDTYRVAYGAKVYGAWQQVQVTAYHLQAPPS